MAKRGRKPLKAGELEARRDAWRSIKRHSGMSTTEIATMLGKKEGTVSGYGGVYPAGWKEIEKLRRTALDRALESLGGAVFRGSEVDEDVVLTEGEKIKLVRDRAEAYGRQPHAA